MQPNANDQYETKDQEAADTTPAADIVANDAPPASAEVDNATTPAPSVTKCKEEPKEEEEPPPSSTPTTSNLRRKHCGRTLNRSRKTPSSTMTKHKT
jgi:hypothetical protein